jgi:RNA polymerase sigma factor for flagellar operon FliA
MFPRHDPRPDIGDSHNHPVGRAQRSRIVESHLAYSHAIAAELSKKLPFHIERKDIEGWAELGLVEAANSFDPSRGTQFKTFAYYRVRGAIYDGLRKMGYFPKGQYRRLRFEIAANEYMKDLSNDNASSGSAQDFLEHLRNVTTTVMSCYLVSLNEPFREPIDDRGLSAEEVLLRSQQTKNLKLALARLPEKNRSILEQVYYDELTLEEVGRRLGLSKSWVCRMHAKSLEMLRKALQDLGVSACPR